MSLNFTEAQHGNSHRKFLQHVLAGFVCFGISCILLNVLLSGQQVLWSFFLKKKKKVNQHTTSSHSPTLKLLPSLFDDSRDCFQKSLVFFSLQKFKKKKIIVGKFLISTYLFIYLQKFGFGISYIFLLGYVCGKYEVRLVCHFKMNAALTGFISVFGTIVVLSEKMQSLGSLFALKLVSLVSNLWIQMFLKALLILSYF